MTALTIYAVLLLGADQIDSERPAIAKESVVAKELELQSAAELERAIVELGSGKYEVRQQATEMLWAAGEAAIPSLRIAVQSKNREIRERAKYVLANLRQGITHDTPREVLQEVQRYRDGGIEERRSALKNLGNAHRPRLVLGLIQSEQDPRLREEWLEIFERSVQSAIAAGADHEVEVALRDAATDDLWIRHWAAFVATRDRINEELSRLNSESPSAGTRIHFLMMAYLLRAKGDLSEARRFAEQAEAIDVPKTEKDPSSPTNLRRGSIPSGSSDEAPGADLAWQLTLEQRDWSAAARQLKVRIEKDPETVAKDPESLGFAAAYHRLAGDRDGSDRYLKMLVKLADELAKSFPELDATRTDAQQALIEKEWQIGKALILNGAFHDAMTVLRRHHASFAFEFLCHQQRYREAFDVAGVDYPNGFNAAWFNGVAAETVSANDEARQRFAIAMHALRQLYFLGQRDQATQWLTAIHHATTTDSGTARRRMVCDTATKLGLRALAIEAGTKVLEREGTSSMLSVLYPGRMELANVWWEYYRDQPNKETLAQSLARIDRCVLMQGSRFEADDLERLIAEAEGQLSQMTESKRTEWWHALAETCLLHGNRRRGLELFENAAQTTAADALRLADLHAADERWPDAAKWYGRAIELEPHKPLALYLQARAFKNAGRDEEAKKLADVALSLPLGNDNLRRELAAGLKERGYREQSLQQFEFLVRTGEPGEHSVIEAAKQIGNAVYVQNPARGADCWETMVLCCLRNKWGFADANGYVQIPFLVHKSRAKGFLMAGRTDEAVREIRAAQEVSLMNLELPEELLPELRRAKLDTEADQLFLLSAAALRQQSRDFPQCATAHNNLAWLLALNGSELDEALQHVEQAVQLDPNNPAYIDTLGEVQFRRGNFAAAVSCAERCLKMDSRSKHYQEQLVRFQSAQKGG